MKNGKRIIVFGLTLVILLLTVWNNDRFLWKSLPPFRYWSLGPILGLTHYLRDFSKDQVLCLLGYPDDGYVQNYWKYKLGRFPIPGSAGALLVTFDQSSGKVSKAYYDVSEQ